MASRSLRNRLGESANIWPGFVDVLATLLIVIIFVLMVFTVSQIYLSDAITGRDKALQELRMQISELSKILQTEISEKEEVLQTLTETESALSGVQQNLREQELISEGLQTDLAKKSTEIFVQEQNILALSDQITELLSELRIVAKALEVYEGLDSAILSTDGLGERINKALAARSILAARALLILSPNPSVLKIALSRPSYTSRAFATILSSLKSSVI